MEKKKREAIKRESQEPIMDSDFSALSGPQGGEIIEFPEEAAEEAEPEKESEGAAEGRASGIDETGDSKGMSGGTEEDMDLELLFKGYPETLALLQGHKGFKVSEELERFMASVEGFSRGSGRSRDEIDASLKMLFEIGFSGERFNFNLDMVETVMKGLIYDSRLAEEVREAELRGRNATIALEMKKSSAGDGIPHLGSRGSSSKGSRGIFGLAMGAR